MDRHLLRWFGHIERMPGDRLTKKIYMGNIDGNRPRGRPAKVWKDCVVDTLQRYSVQITKNKRQCAKTVMNLDEATIVSKDRDVWRRIGREL